MIKRLKRRGIAISPGANRVRIILLFILTPLITWYAHQRFTNPFKKHVTYELVSFDGIPTLHIYNETSVSKSDLLYIPLSKTDTLQLSQKEYSVIEFDSDSLFVFKEKSETITTPQITTETVHIRILNNTLLISGPYFEIALAYAESQLLPSQETDLLLAYDLTDETLFKTRAQLKPRLSITKDFQSDKKIPNIIEWDGKKRLFFKEERYNKLKVISPKDM